MHKYITIYITLVVCLILAPYSWVFASGSAGAIVLHSDGSQKSICVEFPNENISGIDLLKQGNLNPVLDQGFLVELDGEISQSAWQSKSGNNYWYSFIFIDNLWQNINSGVETAKIKDGQIYGWQNFAGTNRLPQTLFSSICKPNSPNENTQASPTKTTSAAAIESEKKSDSGIAENVSPVISTTTNTNLTDKQGTIVDGSVGGLLPKTADKSDDFILILIGLALIGSILGWFLACRRKS